MEIWCDEGKNSEDREEREGTCSVVDPGYLKMRQRLACCYYLFFVFKILASRIVFNPDFLILHTNAGIYFLVYSIA